jgi:hypothetical protein
VNRLALISNPRSHGNRNGRSKLKAVESDDALAGFAEPQDPEALLEALRNFKSRDMEIIAVNGGDGTVREVLTALLRLDAEWRPELAIIPAGKTNLIAHDVGGFGLRPLLKAAGEGRLTGKRKRRRILEIRRYGIDETPICGLFFGAGAFSAGTELAAEKANRIGLYHGAAVIWTLCAMLWRSLRGQPYDPDVESTLMRLQADDGAGRKGPHFIILATTLHRLILRLNPFWGGQNGAIRYTDIAAPPIRLGAGVLPVLLGRPQPWMAEAGYHSGSADRLQLGLTSRFTVDGELFDPGPESRIEITAPRSIEFISP